MGVKRRSSGTETASFDQIEAVYRQDGAALERVAIAIVGDEQGGCDAVQDGFVLALRNREKFRGDAPFVAWIWRIVINEARKRRAREAGAHAVDPSLLESTDPSLNGSADRARVRVLISRDYPSGSGSCSSSVITQIWTTRPSPSRSRSMRTVAATLSAARDRLREQLQEAHAWEI